MVRAGMRKEKVWMVAHSMGGQLTGVVAKDLDFKLPRITGEGSGSGTPCTTASVFSGGGGGGFVSDSVAAPLGVCAGFLNF